MPRAKRVLAATAGVAAVTGIAVAVRRKGRSGAEEEKSDAAGSRSPRTPDARVYHVAPVGDAWELRIDGAAGPESRYGTKREALDAAREAANRAAPSRLVIHRSDGTIQRRHAYEPG